MNARKTLVFLFFAIWLANGLFCKVLLLVPRHREIVGRILGAQYASEITFAIGWAEILMAVWIVSRIQPKICAVAQIVLIGTMNVIEYKYATDLLLFGKLNLVFAFVLITVIFYSEFILNKESATVK